MSDLTSPFNGTERITGMQSGQRIDFTLKQLATYLASGADGLASVNALLGFVSNPNAASTKKFRAARARVRTRTGRGKILVCGDSTAAGAQKIISWPTRMTNRMTAAGVPATSEDMCGNKLQANAALYTGYDPRVTWGSWGYDNTRQTIGCAPLRADAAGPVYTQTPTSPVDTFVMRYMRDAGYGSVSIAIDGAAPAVGLATVSAAGTPNQWVSTTFKASSVGMHSLTVTQSAAGAFFIGQIYAYDSTVPGFDVINGGWATSRSLDWSTLNGANAIGSTKPVFNPIASIINENADLVIINLGINDWDNGVPLADHITNMTAVVTAARSVSDVMIIIQPQTNPSRNANDAVANQRLYVDALTSLAASSGSMLFDVQARFGDFPTANSTGLMADDVHPNPLGYSDWGDGIADALLRL